MGLVVLLRPNNTPGQSDPSAFICVANTHLLYNPRRGDIKLAQLAILLAEISRLSRLPDGSTNPVVLCGDFNSTPWSPLYSFLTRGCLEYGGLQMGMVRPTHDPTNNKLMKIVNCRALTHICFVHVYSIFTSLHMRRSSLTYICLFMCVCPGVWSGEPSQRSAYPYISNLVSEFGNQLSVSV